MGSVSIEKKQNHIHESGFAYDGFGHLAAPGVSILKVSFLVSGRSKFQD